MTEPISDETLQAMDSLVQAYQRRSKLIIEQRELAVAIRLNAEEIEQLEVLVAGKDKGGRPVGSFMANSRAMHIMALLDADPTRVWKVGELAQQFEIPRRNMQSALQHLRNRGMITTAGRGEYQSTRAAHGDERPKDYPIRKSLQQRIAAGRALFEEQRERFITSKELLELGIADTGQQASKVAAALIKQGVVRRVRQGIFVHVSNTTVQAMDRTGKGNLAVRRHRQKIKRRRELEG